MTAPTTQPSCDGGCNPFRQTMDRIGREAAGRTLDGRTHTEFPAVTA